VCDREVSAGSSVEDTTPPGPSEWVAKSSCPKHDRRLRNVESSAMALIELQQQLPAGQSIDPTRALVANLAAELLLIWHDHRLPILLSALAVATIARLVVYSRDRGQRGKLSVPPAPSSPKDTVQLKPEWLPEYTTTLIPSQVNADNHVDHDTSALVAVAETKKGPKRVKGRRAPKKLVAAPAFDHQTDKIQPLVFFQSLSGTTERYAQHFSHVLTQWTR
jgi:tRNA wybutosine-synthesizing protein 1